MIIILNYPNNPTGYTPNKKEVNTIVNAIEELANKGTKVVTVVDDAYYGLFYEEVYQQSIFTALTQVKSSNLYQCVWMELLKNSSLGVPSWLYDVWN